MSVIENALFASAEAHGSSDNDAPERLASQVRQESAEETETEKTEGKEEEPEEGGSVVEEEQEDGRETGRRRAGDGGALEVRSPESDPVPWVPERNGRSERVGTRAASRLSRLARTASEESPPIAAVSPLARMLTPSATRHLREERTNESRAPPVELPELQLELDAVRQERDKLKKDKDRLLASGRQQAKRIHDLLQQIQLLEQQREEAPSEQRPPALTLSPATSPASPHPTTLSEAEQTISRLRARETEARVTAHSLRRELALKAEELDKVRGERDQLSSSLVRLQQRMEEDRAAWEAHVTQMLTAAKNQLDQARASLSTMMEDAMKAREKRWERERKDLEAQARDRDFQLQRHLRQQQEALQKAQSSAEEHEHLSRKLLSAMRRAIALLDEAQERLHAKEEELDAEIDTEPTAAPLLSIEDAKSPTHLLRPPHSKGEEGEEGEGSLFDYSVAELLTTWRERVHQARQQLERQSAQVARWQGQITRCRAFLHRNRLRVDTVLELLNAAMSDLPPSNET